MILSLLGWVSPLGEREGGNDEVQGQEMAERQYSINSSLAYPDPFLPALAPRHQQKWGGAIESPATREN